MNLWFEMKLELHFKIYNIYLLEKKTQLLLLLQYQIYTLVQKCLGTVLFLISSVYRELYIYNVLTEYKIYLVFVVFNYIVFIVNVTNYYIECYKLYTHNIIYNL